MEIVFTTILFVSVVTVTPLALCIMTLRDKVRDLERDLDRERIKLKQWRVTQRPESWGDADDDGNIKNSRPGMAVYVTRNTRGRDLPIGYVVYDDSEFLTKLSELHEKAADRCTDLNALETA